MNFAVLENQNENQRERKDIQILVPCQRAEKELWNMKVMVILIVVGALEMLLKSLEKRLEELEIRGRIKTIQTTAVFKIS